MSGIFVTEGDLYKVLVKLVTDITGRRTWTKVGNQVAPNFPYATVYMSHGEALSYDVVQEIELAEDGPTDPTIKEVVWGTTRLDVEIEFYRDLAVQTAQTAANMLKNSLHRTARDYDLWLVAGLAGDIRAVDISAIFRQDTESRVRVSFAMYANLIDPTAPAADTSIYEIESQEIDILLQPQEVHIVKNIVGV
jgi:hypothetical protein